MLNFKKVFPLLFILSLNSSCTPSKEMSDEEKLTDHEAGAQFIVIDQGYQVAPQPQVKISEDKKTGEINDYWRMERFRDYTFKICLNDRHESRRLRNQKFSVNSFQGKKRISREKMAVSAGWRR